MKHGGDIYRAAKKLHCSPKKIIDFSSNINCYHPKPNLKLTNEIIVPYAQSDYSSLKKTIALGYFLKRSQISLHNGASSAIFELFNTLDEKLVYLYAPLYSEYEKAALDAGKKVIKINRFVNIEKIPKKNSIVVFVNPSTPDGRFYKLKKLFELWQRQNCRVILDESFLEFESHLSERYRINQYEKLYIIHSFSKFYASAGVRIGAVFSTSKNIKKLQTPPWHLSSLDVAFLQQRIKDEKFAQTSRQIHKEQKAELYEILYHSGLFCKIYPSDTNFFLTQSKISKKIYAKLLKHKILLRRCENFDFLDDKYLRFAVKGKKAHAKLREALAEITKR